MKKILFRKLLIEYLSFFLIALLGSSIVVWVFQAVNYLDIMIEDGRDYTIYINYSVLNFPKILSRLYPFVLFFSIYHITSKFEYNNELLILWNFGVNKICTTVSKTAMEKKNFTKLILCNPKFHRIINSLFCSYFISVYIKLKNNTKGRILLIILGKFNKVY